MTHPVSAEPGLSPGDSSQLISFTRDCVHAAVRRSPIPSAPPLWILSQKRACFVTLHKRDALRGCIGSFSADEKLATSIPSLAAACALRDSRFSPVQANELPALDVELSVLTPPRAISSLSEIRLGVDGILVHAVRDARARRKSGCFLPQVATETGWSVEEFVKRCLVDKAGLEADAFSRGAATIEIFQADIFRLDGKNC